MLELFTLGLFSFLMPEPDWVPMRAVDWSLWEEQVWIAALPPTVDAPDPVAIAAMERHLQTLAGLGMPPEEQGLWIQSGNEVLASHRGTVPIPAASLTKIPTTLAALSVWGHDHYFETLVGIRGSMQPNGVLQGDLVIQGGGDPLLVWEEAIALGNALEAIGIRAVTGDLLITGDFYMNFEADPVQSGEWLRQSFHADRWSGEARTQYARMPEGTPQPTIAIAGSVQVVSQLPNDFTPVIRHRSLSLTQILKAMNIFSNNFIADNLAGQMGGGRRVAELAAEAAAVPLEEVQLINGSGLGEDNRISPRAVTTMLMVLQMRLQAVDLTVADFFPVVGRERGTLGDRQLLPGSALKTGTLDRVSSLAGVIPTRERPLVWFSLMDIGTGDLGTLHRQQDQLLQALAADWGIAPEVPDGLQPSDQLPGYQDELGNPDRNEVL